jgi:hypothetical protein
VSLLCKCMNPECPNPHLEDETQEPLTVHFGDAETVTREETVRVAVQDFPIPDDAMAIRIQVGTMPLTVVGWITSGEALPFLLRSVADANEAALKEWTDATPE